MSGGSGKGSTAQGEVTRASMKAVTLQGEHYVVIVPEARVTLVLTREQFIEGLQRAKAWKRRRRLAAREAEAGGEG
jgi:hypothetical protein